MKIKLSMLLLCSMVVFCFSNAKAQSTTPTPSHLHAAERVIDASAILDNMQKVFSAVIQTQAQQVPDEKRVAFVSTMKRFFEKYITNEEVKKAFVPIYAAAFSESELNQIADFLSTPAGKAMITKQPELMNQGMQWGQKIVQDHKDDLQKMMAEAMGVK